MILWHRLYGAVIITISCLVAVKCEINLCDTTSSCTGIDFPITPSEDAVSIKACNGALVKIELTAGDNPDGEDCSLSLSENMKLGDSTEDYLNKYYFSSDNTQNKEMISQSSEVFVSFGSNCKFSLKASCVNWTTGEFSYQFNEDSKYINSTPNSKQTFKFSGDTTQLFVYNSSLVDPLDGYMMVSLEQDAYKHIVYGDLEPLLIETKNNFSQIELITMVPREERNGSLAWNLGEKVEPTTTTTLAPTTTTVYRETVRIMVLGVNEQAFVKTKTGTLQTALDNIIKGFCDLPEGESVTMNEPVSCRRSCWMTDDIDRGCVQVDTDLSGVSPTTICNTTNDLSKTAFYRARLVDRLKDLTKDLGASKMYVDDCNEIEISKPWVITIIIVGTGFLLLAFSILALLTLPKYLLAIRRKEDTNEMNAPSSIDKHEAIEAYDNANFEYNEEGY